MSENALVIRTADGLTVTDAGLAQVERLAANGVSDASIAGVLGINRKTFALWLKDDGDERVLEAYYRGKGALATELVGKLLTHVRNDNVTALIFAMKSLLGMRDQGPATPAVGSAVQVNISVPAPMSAEEFQKMIEVRHQEVRHGEDR